MEDPKRITLFLGFKIKTFEVGKDFVSAIHVYKALNQIAIDYTVEDMQSTVEYHNIGWTLGEERYYN